MEKKTDNFYGVAKDHNTIYTIDIIGTRNSIFKIVFQRKTLISGKQKRVLKRPVELKDLSEVRM